MKLMRQATKATKVIAHGIRRNSNILLTASALIGLVGTAITLVDGTIKAVKICEEKQIKGGKEVIKATYKCYLPSLGFFVITVFSIAGNAASNAKKLAVGASLYSALQADSKEYKEKVKELFGQGKERKVADEAAKAKVDHISVIDPKEEIFNTGHGNKLFMLGLTGQKFRSSPEYIENMELRLNNAVSNDIDGMAEFSMVQDMACVPITELGGAAWFYSDMMEKGYSKIVLDITNCKWVEVNGQQEVLSVLSITPSPTSFG